MTGLPIGFRGVGQDWVQMTQAFLDEIELGLHADWSILRDGADTIVCFRDTWGAAAYRLMRNPIIGQPVPVVIESRE